MYCVFNGRLMPVNEASLSITDLGVLRGYGFFDYLRTYNGIPFLLEEHLDRLERTSSILNLEIPYSRNQIIQWINELLEKNGFQESHIKIVVTGGPSSDGMTIESPTFYILITPVTPNPSSLYTDGITVLMHEYLRPFPEAKSLNYLTSLSLWKKRKEMNAYEILYTHNGNVLEASTSNVFLIKNSVLITPKDTILAGITRDVVLRIAKDVHTVEVRDVTIDELLHADEVFITASNKEVMPVVKIENQTIGNGIPGQQTVYLLDLYRKAIEEYSKNHASID